MKEKTIKVVAAMAMGESIRAKFNGGEAEFRVMTIAHEKNSFLGIDSSNTSRWLLIDNIVDGPASDQKSRDEWASIIREAIDSSELAASLKPAVDAGDLFKLAESIGRNSDGASIDWAAVEAACKSQPVIVEPEELTVIPADSFKHGDPVEVAEFASGPWYPAMFIDYAGNSAARVRVALTGLSSGVATFSLCRRPLAKIETVTIRMQWYKAGNGQPIAAPVEMVNNFLMQATLIGEPFDQVFNAKDVSK